MKSSFVFLALFAALTGCASASTEEGAHAAGSDFMAAPTAAPAAATIAASLESPVGGIDFLLDLGYPAELEGKKILVIGNARIVVPGTVEIVAPKAGYEFATDRPVPADLVGKKVLAVDETHRFVLRLEPARDGTDTATDAPPSDAIFWDITPTIRVDVATIAALTPALAGTDYATDGPASDALFMVLRSGARKPLVQ